MSAADAGEPEIRPRIVLIGARGSEPLASAAEALAEAEIQIVSSRERRVPEWEVFSLATSDDDEALRVLLGADLRAISSAAIIFHLHDRPGALARVVELLERQHVQVRTIHLVDRRAGQAVVAVTTNDDEAARALLDPDALL